jgi:transcriptional regulator with XRE-family HTH domain
MAATGVSQATIATQTRTSQATISRILAGDMVPRPALAARIAAFAGIPLDSFMRGHLAKRAAGNGRPPRVTP